MTDKRYTPPESDLRIDSVAETSTPFLRKFSYSFLGCFLPLAGVSLMLTSPNVKPALIASFAVSLFGGAAGGLFPSNRKWVYIPLSMALVCLGIWALSHVG